MKSIPTARDWMSESVVTLRAGTGMRQAIEFLLGSDLLAVPVIDRQRRLVGILSDKDCLRTVSNWAYEQAAGGTVADYMSSVKAWIDPAADLLQVAGTFLGTQFVHLPVVEAGVLVGSIHRRDVLRGILAWQRDHDIGLQHEHEHARSPGERPHSIEEMQRVVASHSKAQVVSRFRSNDNA